MRSGALRFVTIPLDVAPWSWGGPGVSSAAMFTRSLLFPLASGLGVFLAATNVHGAIVAGNLNVVQNNVGNTASGVAGTAFGYTQGGISYVSGNRGDFTLRFGGTSAAAELAGGIAIASIAQNGRSNEGPDFGAVGEANYAAGIGSGPGYATASIQPLGGGYGTATFIGPSAISTGVKAGDEWNVNHSVAYFKYTEFVGGWMSNDTNNGAMTTLRSSSPGMTIGNGATNTGNWHVFDNTATSGVYAVDLRSFTAPGSGQSASSQTGVLLVVGGKNEANHASSRALEDGTFEVIVRSSDTGSAENDPAGFVYVPAGQEGVVAMGRVDGTGAVADGTRSGNFTIEKGTTGRWLISTTGYDPSNSVFMLSPEGGVGGGIINGDNIYSFEYDTNLIAWVVEGRDLPGSGAENLVKNPTLQNVGVEPAFSFVVISNQVPEPSTGLLGALAGLGLVIRRRRD